MDDIISHQIVFSDSLLFEIAREIAMDILSLPQILDAHKLTQDDWDRIKSNPSFTMYLRDQIAAWNSSTNTGERVRLKAMALVEIWLPELYARMHDPRESLNSKIEAAKLASRLAGLGTGDVNVAGMSERFSVTINLGNTDGVPQQVRIEKNVTIEHNVDEQ